MFKDLYLWKIDSLTALLGLIIGSTMSFIAPVQPFLIMAFALIVCDLITGISAAKRRKDVISSKGIGRSIEKMVMYIIAILLSELFRVTFLTEVAFGMVEQFPIVYIVSITISIRELKSNFENIQVVTGTTLWGSIKDKLTGIINVFKNPKP
jgi:uncharacterized membrane protein